ncbi:hypothetical protein Bca4012_051581 [Brassica carinata]|uniref:Uncharacterized protein n=1 Tax=Brassica carinata TaxID=52824 RepID=A0A8X7R803_BRACI|nr:hypothetical protein Bca52824_054132 [Brassica carinata]
MDEEILEFAASKSQSQSQPSEKICPYVWRQEYRFVFTGEQSYFQGSLRRCLNHEFRALSLTRRFDIEGIQCNKALMISLVYITSNGCWSKVQELYIGDSQDAYIDTLQEYFALGKRCVQILWMRHLINGYVASCMYERLLGSNSSEGKHRSLDDFPLYIINLSCS